VHFAQAFLPAWQARWRQSLAHWSGTIALMVGEDTCTLRCDSTQLQLLESSEGAIIGRLSPQHLTQLVFGYRPVALILQQEQRVPPDEVGTARNILFPYGHVWIPASDWF
jgi:hypothetical protein